jgi:acyl-CoA thioester hydrolase
MGVNMMRTKSFVVYEEIWQRDELCAKGTATYVYMNYANNRSEEIPASVRATFEQHLRDN